jgi:hypothetical protein
MMKTNPGLRRLLAASVAAVILAATGACGGGGGGAASSGAGAVVRVFKDVPIDLEQPPTSQRHTNSRVQRLLCCEHHRLRP